MKPSKYQQAVYDFVSSGTGNGIVNAVAGSGKTTTIVKALELTQGSAVFLAFNKSIATELAKRVPSNAQARTFHSLCYTPVLRALGIKAVDADKVRKIMREVLLASDLEVYGSFILRLLSLARNAGIGCIIPDEESAWVDIAQHNDLSLDHESASPARGIELARMVLRRSNAAQGADFDDLLYFAVSRGIQLPKFDWVLVDEAQDTNAIQRAILRKIMHPGSRLIAVGDPAQAIYGFRGADADSMDILAKEFSCTEMPLSVCYRCDVSIVDAARKYVPTIESREGAAQGIVAAAPEDATLGNDDLVVCRTTAPLIKLAYELIAKRIPCRVMGRDIGQGLVSLAERMQARTIQSLDQKLGSWLDRELEKLRARGEEHKGESLVDKVDSIRAVMDTLPENSRTVRGLVESIESLFRGTTGVTLSTIHKAKGLEADTAYWLNSSACPSRWAKQPWQIQQEHNLMYVAITRARHGLFLLERSK